MLQITYIDDYFIVVKMLHIVKFGYFSKKKTKKPKIGTYRSLPKRCCKIKPSKSGEKKKKMKAEKNFFTFIWKPTSRIAFLAPSRESFQFDYLLNYKKKLHLTHFLQFFSDEKIPRTTQSGNCAPNRNLFQHDSQLLNFLSWPLKSCGVQCTYVDTIFIGGKVESGKFAENYFYDSRLFQQKLNTPRKSNKK